METVWTRTRSPIVSDLSALEHNKGGVADRFVLLRAGSWCQSGVSWCQQARMRTRGARPLMTPHERLGLHPRQGPRPGGIEGSVIPVGSGPTRIATLPT